MKLITILLTLSLTSPAFGTCKKQVELINKGQKAVCTGFLFSPEAEKQVAKDHEDLKFFKDYSHRLEARKELTDKEISILDKRLKLYIDQSEVLSEELTRRNSQSKWEKVIWFGLGIFLSGAAVYGASKLNR